MKEHFTPFRLGVLALLFAGVLASLVDAILVLPFFAAALVLLGVGMSRGWRF